MAYANNFQDPWLVYAYDAPHCAGLYFVYADGAKHEEPRLLYIGESDDIASRVAKHERRKDWEQEALGRSLLFVAVPIESTYVRKRVERIMIDRFKPPCNRETEPRQFSWDEMVSKYGWLFEKRIPDAPECNEDPLNLAVDAYISRNRVSR